MILDLENIFSDQQAITASAASTNVVDLGVSGRDIGRGTPVPILIQVTEDFAGADSLTVTIQTSDAENFGSGVTSVVEQTIPASDLVAGRQLPIQWVPRGVNGRYVRLNYTVDEGPFTGGRITAGITKGNQAGFEV